MKHTLKYGSRHTSTCNTLPEMIRFRTAQLGAKLPSSVGRADTGGNNCPADFNSGVSPCHQLCRRFFRHFLAVVEDGQGFY